VLIIRKLSRAMMNLKFNYAFLNRVELIVI